MDAEVFLDTAYIIALQDESGQSIVVPPDALSRLFGLLGDNIHCVVLNACYSAEQAQAIAQHIDVVIGMSHSISDEVARHFATAFYRALGYRRSYGQAFALGISQIDLHGLPESDRPILLERSE